MRQLVVTTVIGILSGGCALLDELELGGTTSYDPRKIYVQHDVFTVRRRDDLERIVCLTGPLECRAWNSNLWDCVCP